MQPPRGSCSHRATTRQCQRKHATVGQSMPCGDSCRSDVSPLPTSIWSIRQHPLLAVSLARRHSMHASQQEPSAARPWVRRNSKHHPQGHEYLSSFPATSRNRTPPTLGAIAFRAPFPGDPLLEPSSRPTPRISSASCSTSSDPPALLPGAPDVASEAAPDVEWAFRSWRAPRRCSCAAKASSRLPPSGTRVAAHGSAVRQLLYSEPPRPHLSLASRRLLWTMDQYTMLAARNRESLG